VKFIKESNLDEWCDDRVQANLMELACKVKVDNISLVIATETTNVFECGYIYDRTSAPHTEAFAGDCKHSDRSEVARLATFTDVVWLRCQSKTRGECDSVLVDQHWCHGGNGFAA
jgi:hypothetical protein